MYNLLVYEWEIMTTYYDYESIQTLQTLLGLVHVDGKIKVRHSIIANECELNNYTNTIKNKLERVFIASYTLDRELRTLIISLVNDMIDIEPKLIYSKDFSLNANKNLMNKINEEFKNDFMQNVFNLIESNQQKALCMNI